MHTTQRTSCRWWVVFLTVAIVIGWPQAGWSLSVAERTLEKGINPSHLKLLLAEVNAGKYDTPCKESEHSANSWHPIVDRDGSCHYDHHHGDDPDYVNDIFGRPGAWFGRPGQSISYPWQTFTVPADAAPYIQAETVNAMSGKMENQHSHEGYLWIVRRNQPCTTNNKNSEYCVKDFRLQVHAMMFAPGAEQRWHSASLEARVCKDVQDESSCGIIRTGGWVDHGRLFRTAGVDNLDCSLGDNTRLSPYTLDNDTQFWPADVIEEQRRCHPVLSKNITAKAPSSTATQANASWWAKGGPDFRFQLSVFDPIGNMIETAKDSGQFRMHLHCRSDDASCRYNQSIVTASLGQALHVPWAVSTPVLKNGQRYVFKLDNDKDGVTDVTLGKRVFVTRYGAWNPTCRKAALDCIPLVYDNVRLNAAPNESMVPTEAQYTHQSCSNCPRTDYDLTPKGQVSWVSWFQRYRESNLATTENSAEKMEREMNKKQRLGVLCTEKGSRLFVRSKGSAEVEVGCLTTAEQKRGKQPSPYNQIENIQLAQGTSLSASCAHRRLEVKLPGRGQERNRAQLICR